MKSTDFVARPDLMRSRNWKPRTGTVKACENCGTEFYRVPRLSKPPHERKCCSVACRDALRVKKLADLPARFFANVIKGATEDDCWKWTAQKRWDGYGRFVHRYRPMWAHRYSYELHHGPIPKGGQILHTCDNPECANPKHLRLGTREENMAEMRAKDRHAGSLTADQVREIRKALEAPYFGVCADLARKYGVGASAISDIRNGHTYGFVK